MKRYIHLYRSKTMYGVFHRHQVDFYHGKSIPVTRIDLGAVNVLQVLVRNYGFSRMPFWSIEIVVCNFGFGLRYSGHRE